MNVRLFPYVIPSPVQAPVLLTRQLGARPFKRRAKSEPQLRCVAHTSRANDTANLQAPLGTRGHQQSPNRVLSKVTTINLLRSLLLGYCFTSPRLLRVSLRLMDFFVHSKSPFLDPDKNVIVGSVLKSLIYNHFCAGTTPSAVKKSIERTKSFGYSGVILGYSREILVEDVATSGPAESESRAIDSWMQANLDTLDLIGPGDHMNIKFTGAGEGTSKALLEGLPPSAELVTAMDIICRRAAAQGSSVWIDAEQQLYQATVNDWAIKFMSRWNLNGESVIYNTIQAYLKSSRDYVDMHLRAASAGDWTCAIKLVRGAYLQSDIRERIWDTKAETDENYNSIVRDLLTKQFGTFGKEDFPNVRLFIAGHNRESVRLATKLVSKLVSSGENVGPVQYGQLQGMADEVSCELVHMKEAAINIEGLTNDEANARLRATPQPYKCLIWGSVNGCLHFLQRRAVENATAAGRLKDGLDEVRNELKSRLCSR